MVLPKRKRCTIEFLQQLLEGSKLHVKIKDAECKQIAKWNEISIDKVKASLAPDHIVH